MDMPDGMTRSVRTAAPAAGSTACPFSTRGERRHVGPDCPNGDRRLRDRPRSQDRRPGDLFNRGDQRHLEADHRNVTVEDSRRNARGRDIGAGPRM